MGTGFVPYSVWICVTFVDVATLVVLEIFDFSVRVLVFWQR